MKNTMRKMLILVAVVVMAIVCFAFSASALEETGQCGDNVYWEFDRKTGHLLILGSGTMYDNAFVDRQEIKSVVIEEGVTNVSDSAFWNCNNLERVVLPQSLIRIESYAFAHTGIESIGIQKNVSYIGEAFVMHCNKLVAIAVHPDNKYFETVNCEPYGVPVLFNESLTKVIQYPIGYQVDTIKIPDGVKCIGNTAFNCALYLKSIELPKELETIESDAFSLCVGLENIVIPHTVKKIERDAFIACYRLSDIYISSLNTAFDYRAIGLHEFKPINVSIDKIYEKFIELFDSKTVGELDSLHDKYFERCDIYSYGTIHCKKNSTAETYAKNNGIDYVFLKYNLGEETYSFKNFSDKDSDGHCFGMSVTSAGYFLNCLDINDLNINNSSKVYTLKDTKTVKKPICYYQPIQGSFSNSAIVAGGKHYISDKIDIDSDWEEVVNYVKNHKYDDCGALQIGFRKIIKSKTYGHAINFLRYEVVNGQERIYAYDNNFPDTETYFYMNSKGEVLQEPSKASTFGKPVDSICLRDVNKYFEIAKKYNAKKIVYGDSATINVTNADAFVMDCYDDDSMQVMFELKDDVSTITITPLADNATFTYMGNEYRFNKIDEDTYAEFTLSTSEEDLPEFKIFDAPEDETDLPTEPESPDDSNSASCSHLCHKNGFMGFIWKIVRFFYKLLGSNKVCSCGVAHY